LNATTNSQTPEIVVAFENLFKHLSITSINGVLIDFENVFVTLSCHVPHSVLWSALIELAAPPNSQIPKFPPASWPLKIVANQYTNKKL